MSTQTVSRSIHPLIGHDYLRLVSGSGVYVTDDEGRTYLDAVAGIGVMALGYGREDLVEAAAEQARRIPFVHSMRFWNEPSERLAADLAAFAPGGLNWSFFCSGGSEATESALKLVRQYWLDRGIPSKWKVIGRRPSFHGNTLTALAVGYHAARRERYRPYLVDMPHLAAPWIYRCARHGPDGPFCDDCSGRSLAALIEAEGPDTVAAFIAEPIVGAASPGITPPPGYYETIREICDRHDVLLLSDEVICGIGRTGRRFGIEHWAAEPDLMLLAKGISAGYAPLAAVMVHDRVMDVLRAGSRRYEHNFTMAGNPVACAVGSAVLAAVAAERVVERVAEQEAVFFGALERLRRHPFVGDVRGRGLIAGVEFVQPGGIEPYPSDVGVTARVEAAARSNGLLVYPCSGIVDGRLGDSIMLLPPLVITEAEIVELVDRLDRALDQTGSSLPRE
jgi:adenosylmethionine-8-amino-7-oxononanoate aminotransferase